MRLHWLPNALCGLRILLAPLVAWLLLGGEYRLTLGVFFFAAVTDALDGFLAKRFNWISELGKVLDPLADKVLLVTVFITLAVLMQVPVWLASLVVLRDVVIGIGALSFRVLHGPLHGAPTLLSKLNTLMQIVYVLIAVSLAGKLIPDSGFLTALGWFTAATTLASGADYVLTYSRRAAERQRQRHSQL